MKSLLVDALRQANKAEANGTLSDSGSFDAARGDFGSMTGDENDVTEPEANVDAMDDSDLELLEAGEAALQEKSSNSSASNDANEMDDDENIISDSLSSRYASADNDLRSAAISIRTAAGDAPLLSRYAPLICACLALAASVLWSTYLKIDERHSATALGAAFAQSRQPLYVDGREQVAHAERFPFLSASAHSTEVEAPE